MRCLVFAAVLTAISVGQARGQYYGTSTPAAEGNAFANIVRSAGEASLMNAQAANEAEYARNAYIKNQLEATNTYFDIKRANAAYRLETESRPFSLEQYIRIAQIEAPDRMTANQFDVYNGKIYWPAELMDEAYATYRDNLSNLFRRRALGDPRTYPAIRAQTAAWLETLKLDIENFPPQDYVKAKNYVESLAYEARFASQ